LALAKRAAALFSQPVPNEAFLREKTCVPKALAEMMSVSCDRYPQIPDFGAKNGSWTTHEKHGRSVRNGARPARESRGRNRFYTAIAVRWSGGVGVLESVEK
jgi:hypothetical protein